MPSPPTASVRSITRQLLTVALATAACGTPVARRVPPVSPGAWRDASPHGVRFVQVAGARLHLLDWGGHGDVARGEVLVFLHGYNSDAHVFDDLAPRFTDRFRVLAITERGFGESGAEGDAGRYSLDGAADDLRAVLDSVGVSRVVLAAHSMGGWVMSRFAVRYPERVTRLVYLDATFDVNASDSIVARRPVTRPPLSHAETAEDVTRWLARYFYGTWTPALEAEYRARPDDEAARAMALKPLLADHHAHVREFDRVRQPALALCAAATVASEFPWLTLDSARYADARRYVEQVRRPFQLAECTRFLTGAPNRRGVVLDGPHYIFVTRQDAVTRAMRDYLR
jgi:Predicted hydrolases or acyltransferases (alpha/beta hydrolase superfamily)